MTKSLELLEVAVKAADLKRAENIMAVDVQNISLLADYYMICEGSNVRQIEAIANEVIEKIEEAGGQLKQVEGMEKAEWILLDFGDLIVHVLNEDTRSFYQLEKLWIDATPVDVRPWVSE